MRRAPVQLLAAAVALLCAAAGAPAQDLFVRRGEPIPPQVERMYLSGLRFLVQRQAADGSWPGEGQDGPGITGIAIVAILAHGDDPQGGPFADALRRSIRSLLKAQDARTGYIGPSMYHHGFATLALAEAYGAVDEPGIGPALQKAVQLILAAQKRSQRGAWRYTPDSSDADTTVSGAQVVALCAARNAGIAVPDDALRKALAFYRACQDAGSGGIGYTESSGPNNVRSAIGALAFTLGGERDTAHRRRTLAYLRSMGWNRNDAGYPFYFAYYASQAAFHADEATWSAWNTVNISQLASQQQKDGSWSGSISPTFDTAAALLSLALNYRYLPIYER